MSGELNEALKSIGSTLAKSEKAETKLKANTSQYTMILDAIKTYKIATELNNKKVSRKY